MQHEWHTRTSFEIYKVACRSFKHLAVEVELFLLPLNVRSSSNSGIDYIHAQGYLAACCVSFRASRVRGHGHVMRVVEEDEFVFSRSNINRLICLQLIFIGVINTIDLYIIYQTLSSLSDLLLDGSDKKRRRL